MGVFECWTEGNSQPNSTIFRCVVFLFFFLGQFFLSSLSPRCATARLPQCAPLSLCILDRGYQGQETRCRRGDDKARGGQGEGDERVGPTNLIRAAEGHCVCTLHSARLSRRSLASALYVRFALARFQGEDVVGLDLDLAGGSGGWWVRWRW